MHAILADQGIERRHLGDIAGRHRHALLGGEDVKFVRVEDEALICANVDRLPEVEYRAGADNIDVNETRMTLGAVTNEAMLVADQIDGQGNVLGNVHFAAGTGAKAYL